MIPIRMGLEKTFCSEQLYWQPRGHSSLAVKLQGKRTVGGSSSLAVKALGE